MRKLDAPWCCSEHQQSGCPTFMDERCRWISNTSRWKAVSERGHFNQEKVHINDAECIYELGHKHSFPECLLGPKATFRLCLHLYCKYHFMFIYNHERNRGEQLENFRERAMDAQRLEKAGTLWVRVHRSLFEFQSTPNLNPGWGYVKRDILPLTSEILISTFPGLKYPKLV